MFSDESGVLRYDFNDDVEVFESSFFCIEK